MVKEASTTVSGAVEARAAERRLVLSYAPTAVRAGLSALLELDDALADVLRHVSDPMIAQMRLTWWHDALTKLDEAPPPAQPVLRALAEHVLPTGIRGAELAATVEGWESLLEGDPVEAGVRATFAERRGMRLFELGARLDGAGGDVGDAGRGWALADLSRSLSDADAARAAADEGRAQLGRALGRRWPRRLRALGALAHQAAMDLREPLDRPLPGATPGRVARLGWHRLTGR